MAPLRVLLLAASSVLLLLGQGRAADLMPDRARLLMTAGVSSVEGPAGGGLVPWGVIAGYGTNASWGANAFSSRAVTGDYDLASHGGAVGIANRVEFSFARHGFDLDQTGEALGLGEHFTLRQSVYGAKLRVFGHLIADQGSAAPQVTIGVQHKRAGRGAVLSAVGAGDDEGTDLIATATKLFLARSVIATVGLRYTNANQFGLLGFGGDRRSARTLHPEASIAYLASRRLAVGAEYRGKPDNLSFAKEDDAVSAFVAYFPSKHLSVTGAYLDLGAIGGEAGQRGAYLSLQTGF